MWIFSRAAFLMAAIVPGIRQKFASTLLKAEKKFCRLTISPGVYVMGTLFKFVYLQRADVLIC